MSALPTPSALAASWALQIAGKIDPPVGSPRLNANRNSGTSSKWSARYCADACTRSRDALSGSSGALRAFSRFSR